MRGEVSVARLTRTRPSLAVKPVSVLQSWSCRKCADLCAFFPHKWYGRTNRFAERGSFSHDKPGWRTAAIGGGLLLFKLGSLLLTFAGIAVWKTAVDPANEVSGPC